MRITVPAGTTAIEITFISDTQGGPARVARAPFPNTPGATTRPSTTVAGAGNLGTVPRLHPEVDRLGFATGS